MSRDYNQTLRKGRKIGKINKTLTLPSFSYTTFRSKNSVEIKGSGFVHKATGVAYDIDNLTLEFWVRPGKYSGAPTYLALYDSTNTVVIQVYVTSADVLTAAITTTSGTYSLTTTEFSYDKWNHIAVTFDSTLASKEFNLYTQGKYRSQIDAPGNLAAGAGDLALGTRVAALFSHNYYGEIRIWSETRNEFEIESHYNTPRDLSMTVETALTGYWDFVVGTGATILDVIGGADITISTGATWDSTIYPPIIFGASFARAEGSITLDSDTSIVFPVIPPSSNNFGLAITWTDSNGDFQRRFLFDASGSVGVDYGPEKLMYNGERIVSPFIFELWNIDGNQTIDMTSDLTVGLSRATKPTSDTDETPISDGSIVWDITIGEDYPWASSLTFTDALVFA